MAARNIRLVDIKEGLAFPFPEDLTAEEEAAVLAKAKAAFDPVACEAELRELLKQRDQGLLVSADEVMKKFE